MLETKKILKAFNDKLKELYPTYKIYGVETKEGYKTPCFNTELVVKDLVSLNAYFTRTHIVIICDFLMTTVDTVIQMGVIDTINKTFYKYLKVNDRVLHVAGISQDMTGEYNDIVTFEIDIFVYENHIDKTIDHPIEQVNLKLKRKDDIFS